MDNLTGFKLWLYDSERKKSTILRHVRNFAILEKLVNSFDIDAIRGMVVSMKEQGYSPRYINTLLNTLKVYGNYTNQEHLIHLKFIREEEVVKSLMSDEEIEAFLALPPPKNGRVENYARWTTFFKTLALTGMRPGELAKVTVDDLDFGRSVFILRDTKTNDNRLVPIPPNLIDNYKDLISRRDRYLFPSLRGGNKDGLGAVVDNVDWHYNFHARLRRLGIRRKGLTPYSLRFSFITRMLDESVSLFHVQRIVGHKRIETTAGYTRLSTKELQKAILKLPLIKKNTDPQTKLKLFSELIQAFNLRDDPSFEFDLNESGNEIRLVLKVKECKVKRVNQPLP